MKTIEIFEWAYLVLMTIATIGIIRNQIRINRLEKKIRYFWK